MCLSFPSDCLEGLAMDLLLQEAGRPAFELEPTSQVGILGLLCCSMYL